MSDVKCDQILSARMRGNLWIQLLEVLRIRIRSENIRRTVCVKCCGGEDPETRLRWFEGTVNISAEGC